MVAYAFSAAQYQPSFAAGGGLPVNPDGSPCRYKVIISDTSQEETADKQGGFLRVECKVIEGPLTGQTQDIRLNLHNKSQKAVEIANKQLAAICHVTGTYQFQDTVELHNKPFQIEVRKQKTGDYTEVGNVFDINGNEPGKAAQQPVQQMQPPPQAAPPAGVAPANAAPWEQGQAAHPWTQGQAAQPPAAQAPQPGQWPGQPALAPQQPAQPPQAGAWPGQGAPAANAPPWGR